MSTRRRQIPAEQVRPGMVLDIARLGLVRVRHVSHPAPGHTAFDLHLDPMEGQTLPMGGMYGAWTGLPLTQVVEDQPARRYLVEVVGAEEVRADDWIFHLGELVMVTSVGTVDVDGQHLAVAHYEPWEGHESWLALPLHVVRALEEVPLGA